jgi:hypothetical protein
MKIVKQEEEMMMTGDKIVITYGLEGKRTIEVSKEEYEQMKKDLEKDPFNLHAKNNN